MWSLTKEGIDEFVIIYNIPIKLSGLCLLLAGAAFTYYRTNLNYRQIDLSLNQNIKQTYTTLRDEFIVIRSSYPYKNELLTFQDITLFNIIYPNAKTGGYHLSRGIENYLFPRDTSDTSNFQGMLKSLTDLIKTKEQFLSVSYNVIIQNYNKLRKILPVEHEVIIPDKNELLFVNEYANVLISILEEIINTVDSLNTFEDLNITQTYQNKIIPFFKEFKINDSRYLIGKLTSISTEALEIQSSHKLINELGILDPLINEKIDLFNNENPKIISALPYSENAREFLYDMCTKEYLNGTLNNEKGKQVFRDFLNLAQIKNP